MFDLKSRILVVDDMLTVRKIVTKILREMGFTEFIEADDGAKAWEKLRTASPKIDLVISDWNMPNCTGIDFLKKVRKDPTFSATPFVLLTAEAESTQVLEAVNAGVTTYIIKPFTAQSLTEKLEAAHKKVSAKRAA